MVTEQEYKKALGVVDAYRCQLRSCINANRSADDIYEWVKAEMMATTDITQEEFDDLIQTWVAIKRKQIDIEKHHILNLK